jgi:hypothetical protein
VFAAGPGLKAVLVQAGERGVEIGDHHGKVGARRDGRALLVHQVDLGAVALEPGEAVAQRGGRFHLREAEQGEELGGAV